MIDAGAGRPFAWSKVQSCFERPLFDRGRVLELFSQIGRPDDHAEKVDKVVSSLNYISANFAFDLWRERQPSSAAEESEARRLAETCRLLLKIIGSGDADPTPENIHPFFGNGGLYAAAKERGEANGRAATMNALRAVHLLQVDAERLVEIASKRRAMKPLPKGRPEARAMKHLVESLAHLYAETWERNPGIALQPKAGPFVHLLVEVASALRQRLGNHAFSFTPESLAKVWRDLPEDQKSKRLEPPESWLRG
jgi:hypothetical protein